MKTTKIELTLEEMILVRDAMLDMKHNLKNAPSERGKKLCGMSAAIAETLDNNINNRRF